ncbi:hypothetical protein TNCV_4552731 [Trichonephila clavipes]|nr:hypothetical protein TNCV_4552731 [Trichonephila clavipes]
MNHASVCRTTMAAFVLLTLSVNAAFQSAFQNDIAWSYGLRCDFVSWTIQLAANFRPAYSPDTSPIEHIWDLVGRRLARDPCPAASKDDLLLHMHEPERFFRDGTLRFIVHFDLLLRVLSKFFLLVTHNHGDLIASDLPNRKCDSKGG